MKTLFFFLMIVGLASCGKAPVVAYTPNLNRSFVWQRQFFTTRGAQGDTTFFYSDTVAAIVVVNDSSLIFLEQRYTYAGDADLDYIGPRADPATCLRYVDRSSIGPHRTDWIDYYYLADSVVASFYSSGRGGYRIATYTTRW